MRYNSETWVASLAVECLPDKKEMLGPTPRLPTRSRFKVVNACRVGYNRKVCLYLNYA